MKVIYRITYPNGKICSGKDLTGTLKNFGSADSGTIAQNFSPDDQRGFTIRKEILWQSGANSDCPRPRGVVFFTPPPVAPGIAPSGRADYK